MDLVKLSKRKVPAKRRVWGWILVAMLLGSTALWYFFPQVLPKWMHALLPSPNWSPPLYKWKDEQGQWHVTDVPPQSRPYETVVNDPQTNVLPSAQRE